MNPKQDRTKQCRRRCCRVGLSREGVLAFLLLLSCQSFDLVQSSSSSSAPSSSASWWGRGDNGSPGDDNDNNDDDEPHDESWRDPEWQSTNNNDGNPDEGDDDMDGSHATSTFPYDNDLRGDAPQQQRQAPPNRRPPPPPPPGSTNMNRRPDGQRSDPSQQQQQQRPPPRPPSAATVTFGASGSSSSSGLTPIDYSFPSKELKASVRPPEQKQKSSLFGWGGNKQKEKNVLEERDRNLEDGFNNRKDGAPGDFSRRENDNYRRDETDEFGGGGGGGRRQRPPPRGDENDRPWVDPSMRPRRPRPDDFASARRDPVARYMAQSVRHKMTVFLWSTGAGAALGGYCGKSLFGNPYSWALVFAMVFSLTSVWARNPYGDWTRAVGLACWWSLVKSRRIRREYPTGRHFRAMLGIGPRRPFPPNTDNPWTYRADEDDETAVIFEMWSALACMVLVGSLAGGSVPIIPSWMGALGGAASLAILTTRKDPRGDLCRSAGMRVRRTMGLAWAVLMDDLQMPQLTGAMTRKILDKILILDRQHKLQDKLMSASSWVFNLFQNMIRQARGEQVEEEENSDDNRRNRGGDRDDRSERRPPQSRRRPPPRNDRDRDRRDAPRDGDYRRQRPGGDDPPRRRGPRDDDRDAGTRRDFEDEDSWQRRGDRDEEDGGPRRFPDRRGDERMERGRRRPPSSGDAFDRDWRDDGPDQR